MPRVPSFPDVTVVGAGPAGSMTAYHLARRGLQVRILERRNFPRDKACGGGLTLRARQHVPFDLGAIVEDVGRTLRLAIGNRLLMEQRMSPPPILLVRRERFDTLLVEKAVRAGAVFQEGTEFRSVTGSFGELKIETSRGMLRSRVIVGADGVQSRVRKMLDCGGPPRSMLALEARVRPHPGLDPGHFRSRVDFDFPGMMSGYGWVFPKENHLSVGILRRETRPRHMKRSFLKYLKSKGLRQADIVLLRGHRIPWTDGRNFRLSDSRGVLVGDAAGLCDPITGEGIYSAVFQARLAAESIFDCFSTGQELMAYDRKIQTEFAADNHCARWMGAFLYRFPGFSRRLLNLRRQFLLQRYLQVAAGETTYRAEFRPPVLLRHLAGL